MKCVNIMSDFRILSRTFKKDKIGNGQSFVLLLNSIGIGKSFTFNMG